MLSERERKREQERERRKKANLENRKRKARNLIMQLMLQKTDYSFVVCAKSVC